MEPVRYDAETKCYVAIDERDRERRRFPDAVRTPEGSIIKREKKFSEMTQEDYDKYSVFLIRYAAKDIAFGDATFNH